MKYSFCAHHANTAHLPNTRKTQSIWDTNNKLITLCANILKIDE